MIFFSPSLYVTVSVWPSIPAAWLATVALVMVLLGKSQFEKPSGGCTPGGKMRIAVAFWLPSGCGEAVMARYEPSFISESGALTTSLTGALSASLIFIYPPCRHRHHRPPVVATAALRQALKTRPPRYSGELAWERADRRMRTVGKFH